MTRRSRARGQAAAPLTDEERQQRLLATDLAAVKLSRRSARLAKWQLYLLLAPVAVFALVFLAVLVLLLL